MKSETAIKIGLYPIGIIFGLADLIMFIGLIYIIITESKEYKIMGIIGLITLALILWMTYWLLNSDKLEKTELNNEK